MSTSTTTPATAASFSWDAPTPDSSTFDTKIPGEDEFLSGPGRQFSPAESSSRLPGDGVSYGQPVALPSEVHNPSVSSPGGPQIVGVPPASAGSPDDPQINPRPAPDSFRGVQQIANGKPAPVTYPDGSQMVDGKPALEGSQVDARPTSASPGGPQKVGVEPAPLSSPDGSQITSPDGQQVVGVEPVFPGDPQKGPVVAPGPGGSHIHAGSIAGGQVVQPGAHGFSYDGGSSSPSSADGMHDSSPLTPADQGQGTVKRENAYPQQPYTGNPPSPVSGSGEQAPPPYQGTNNLPSSEVVSHPGAHPAQPYPQQPYEQTYPGNHPSPVSGPDQQVPPPYQGVSETSAVGAPVPSTTGTAHNSHTDNGGDTTTTNQYHYSSPPDTQPQHQYPYPYPYPGITVAVPAPQPITISNQATFNNAPAPVPMYGLPGQPSSPYAQPQYPYYPYNSTGSTQASQPIPISNQPMFNNGPVPAPVPASGLPGQQNAAPNPSAPNQAGTAGAPPMPAPPGVSNGYSDPEQSNGEHAQDDLPVARPTPEVAPHASPEGQPPAPVNQGTYGGETSGGSTITNPNTPTSNERDVAGGDENTNNNSTTEHHHHDYEPPPIGPAAPLPAPGAEPSLTAPASVLQPTSISSHAPASVPSTNGVSPAASPVPVSPEASSNPISPEASSSPASHTSPQPGTPGDGGSVDPASERIPEPQEKGEEQEKQAAITTPEAPQTHMPEQSVAPSVTPPSTSAEPMTTDTTHLTPSSVTAESPSPAPTPSASDTESQIHSDVMAKFGDMDATTLDRWLRSTAGAVMRNSNAVNSFVWMLTEHTHVVADFIQVFQRVCEHLTGAHTKRFFSDMQDFALKKTNLHSGGDDPECDFFCSLYVQEVNEALKFDVCTYQRCRGCSDCKDSKRLVDIPRGQAQAEVSQSDLNVAQNEMMIANNASNDPYAPDARLLNANTDAKRRHTAAVRNQTLALKNVSEVSNQLWYSTRSPEWYNATQENARKKIELDEHFVCSASIASASSHVGIDRLQMSGAMGAAAAKGRAVRKARAASIQGDGVAFRYQLGLREQDYADIYGYFDLASASESTSSNTDQDEFQDSVEQLKKNLANKIFGYLARCEGKFCTTTPKNENFKFKIFDRNRMKMQNLTQTAKI